MKRTTIPRSAISRTPSRSNTRNTASRGRATARHGQSNQPGVDADVLVAMIEELESRINQLENVIEVGATGKVRIKSSGNLELKAINITCDAMNKVVIKAVKTEFDIVTFEVDASANVDFNASGKFEVASSSLDLSSQGTASLSGSTTRLGPGTKPVAVGSVSGGAAGVSFSATMPSPSVLA